MIVSVKYLNDNTRTGVNQIEDWYLPADAFRTSFFDQHGRRLYLIGSRDAILREDRKLDENPSVDYDGHIFRYIKG